MAPTTSRLWCIAAATLAAGALAACSDDADGAPTSTTPPPSATTSSTTSSTTTTSEPPTPEELAGKAVIAFYQELDLVAQGKARLDSFRHAATGGDDTTTTLPKWQGILGNRLLAGNVQVGETAVSIVKTTKGKKAKAWNSMLPSWTVVACVDHTASRLENKGTNVPWPGQARETVTHVVVDQGDDAFAVVRDDPGKSC